MTEDAAARAIAALVLGATGAFLAASPVIATYRGVAVDWSIAKYGVGFGLVLVAVAFGVVLV